MTTRKKRIIAIIVIFISLPLDIATAAGGVNLIGLFFAAIFAIGIDMLMESSSKSKTIKPR